MGHVSQIGSALLTGDTPLSLTATIFHTGRRRKIMTLQSFIPLKARTGIAALTFAAEGVIAMKLKLSAALAAACCALALSVGTARADSVFDLSGTFFGALGGTLSGTLTIDV